MSFLFNDTAPTEIYTLSLHDALPISGQLGTIRKSTTCPRKGSGSRSNRSVRLPPTPPSRTPSAQAHSGLPSRRLRSEEHTSELQSRLHLVCRLLLEKKKKHKSNTHNR